MNLLYAFDLLGTAAFAASGAWAGIRRHMDLLGVLVLGLVTAIGGGTLRDILLGDTPPFCLQNDTYLYLSIGVALVVLWRTATWTISLTPCCIWMLLDLVPL